MRYYFVDYKNKIITEENEEAYKRSLRGSSYYTIESYRDGSYRACISVRYDCSKIEECEALIKCHRESLGTLEIAKGVK